MTYLSYLARHICQRRTHIFILMLSIALVAAQPLLVSAKPATRGLTQLAQLAQLTPSPPEEPTDENNGDEAEPTAELTLEPTEEPPPADQSNMEVPGVEGTNIITFEIPTDETPTGGNSFALPFTWEGEATISAQELAEVAPPLQAEVSQGDFQIAFVPAETGDVLRILPVTAAGGLGSLRLGVKLEPSSAILPFPAGQTLLVQISARVYAPDASTRLVIADQLGSSSVTLEGLNWGDYQVTRQIDADATSLEVILEWRNVPANGWLEMRGLDIVLLAPGEITTLSPTDTPTVIEAVTSAPTAPPSPIPTAIAIATATPLPTATPIPDGVAAEAAGDAVADTDAVSETVTPTPTYIVVTSTPTPVDVFEEATRVAQATDWARIIGPATPTPPNLATPTPTLTPFIIALVNTPTPANAATATYVAIRATAVAFTTGTPTPFPAEATVLVATETSPPPTPTPRPTHTPTPVFVLLDSIPTSGPPAPTPAIPAVLQGKIVFLTAYRGNPRQPNAMVINPDGTGIGLLTTNFFYGLAANRDTYSADNRYRVYSLREAGGEAHNAGRVQIFYDDLFYTSLQHQLSYFGAGVAWAPVWSPTSESVAFVSSESGNDEIWVGQRGQWPAIQLTKNDWEWDHHPSFSPDGSEIVFSSNRVTGRRQLWIMSSSGENPRQITNLPYEAWDPVWVKYVEGQ